MIFTYKSHLYEVQVVHIDEEPRYDLAVHAIHDTAVPWNQVTKIFDLEGPLKPRREESAKRGDNGDEAGPPKAVHLQRGEGHPLG